MQLRTSPALADSVQSYRGQSLISGLRDRVASASHEFAEFSKWKLLSLSSYVASVFLICSLQ